jgi:LmbE family N-acetylglucosaminyl deacetylase
MPPSLSRASCVSLVIALSLGLSHPTHASGPPAQPDAARIALGLRKLGVVGSVLYVAAHPDDENTALISYLANGQLVRTGYLSVTRGDGGQNLVGAEQGPALGLVRTQELLAARRIDGGEQFFTRARDFGFSKSPEETLKIWGKDAVLADMVAVIRGFRPDVIVTRFSPEPSDTHGHHTASAILAVEAFRAAADPKFHPEQLTAGVTPWQARRILWNRSSWSIKPGEPLTGFFTTDAGGYSPLLGLSFGEIAADSRSMHKSQGFGIARSRGPAIEYFKVLGEADTAKPAKTKAPVPDAGKPPVGDILAGLDLGWKRLAGGAAVAPQVAAAARAFEPTAPHKSIPALLKLDAALDAVKDTSWRDQKRRELHALIVACGGLFADATAGDFRAAPGTEVEITATAINRSPAALTLEEIRFPFAGSAAVGKALAQGTPLEQKRSVKLPADLPLSTPYWYDAPPEPGLYTVADPRLVGAPEAEPAVKVAFVFKLPGGRALTVERAVSFKWTDPVMGERYRPFEVTPLVSVRPAGAVMLFAGESEKPLEVTLAAGAEKAAGTLRAEAPAGWTVDPPTARFALAGKGTETTLLFRLRPGRDAVAGTLRLSVGNDAGAAAPARGVVHFEHAHIPIQTMLLPAEVRLQPIALATGGRRLGYIPGPGDEVPAALRGVGYAVTLLDAGAVTTAQLAAFDAVVVGVRAFNTSERLRAAHPALMAYVEGGGTLVVQYNTNNRLAPLSTPLGPWPFTIGQHRVTDETAPITTVGTHPAVTIPNPIGPRDFENWVQERGLYFAETWDSHYETPLAMHDPGEAPQQGGLLWARYGKGTYVYTGLSFFRQLPAGVPGAFRLFANLLAGGRSK